MSRSLPLFVCALLCAIAALLFHDEAPEERLQHEAERLQQQVNTAARELERLCVATPARIDTNDARAWSTVHHLRDSLVESGTDVLLRERGQEYWTSAVPFDDAALDTLPMGHARSGWGVHLVAGALSKTGRCFALRLVWQQPPIENRYLVSGFHPSMHVAEGVEAMLAPGLGPVVRDAAGQVMFRLQWRNDAAPPGWKAQVRAWCSLVSVLLLVCGALIALLRRTAGQQRWRAVVLFIIVLFALRWLSLGTGPWSAFEGMRLFDPALFAATAELPSLGDLLLNIAVIGLAVWALRAALKEAPRPSHAFGPAVMVLLVLSLFAVWIDHVMIALVRDSRIPLDLFHVQDMNGYSVIAMLAIAALLACWSLLADALIRWLTGSVVPRTVVWLVMGWYAAWLVLYHALGIYDSARALWSLPPIALLWLMQRGRDRSLWLSLLVACLAIAVAHTLNYHSFKRTEAELHALAEDASSEEDPVIEALFNEAVGAISQDADARLLLNDDTLAIATSELDRRVRQRFFRGPWEKYAVRLHVFHDGVLRGSTSPDLPPTLPALLYRFGQGTPVAGDLALHNTHRPTERAAYIGIVSGLSGNDLFVELMPNFLPEGLGFPELLLAGGRTHPVPSGRFVRARYERGTLVESTGDRSFPIAWSGELSRDDAAYEEEGYIMQAKGDARGTVIVVGTLAPTWIEEVTAFSYVAVFFAVIAGVAGWSITNIARKPRASDLATKVRNGVLVFAGVALLMFAFGTQRTIGERIEEHTRQQLDERARSAVAEMRQHIHGETRIAPEQYNDVDHWLDDASTILLTDLTLYTPEGSLLATSREQVFNTGLLGQRLDPEAYHALAIERANSFMHDERIGTAVFRTAYRPFLNDRGEVLAFLALPYFARQSELEQERASGMVATVNLFVLLFVLSVVAAAVITDRATRPLAMLRRGLERIQLGARNEPIHYSGDDELGELVRVYNRKVDELRESAEKLARSERESAWKEMARQVAHEIKNPLTPMKLGIQHFQHTWDPDAPDAKAKLDRFTNSMVEQIDALSRVAGDFSRFAQMSVAHETVLDLNEVAKSAVALFAGEPNADITLHTAQPLMVKADREHLLRVFNNLLKNALQAIPEKRRGVIEVTLREECGHAVAMVKDNGSGIPEEARDRIFTPSFTTKSSGMGLGLAMVKRMVEQAGGRVWFETVTGGGTRFFAELPLAQQPSHDRDPTSH